MSDATPDASNEPPIDEQALDLARQGLKLASASLPHLAGLARLVRLKPSQRVGVAAIGPSGLLAVRPDLFATLTLGDAAFIMAHELMHLALDTSGRIGGANRLDFLPSDEPLPDEQAEGSIDGERRHNWLHAALGQLNEREMKIIRARRLAENGATLEELGAVLGISKERVRQIENRALEKLKAVLLSKTTDFAYA